MISIGSVSGSIAQRMQRAMYAWNSCSVASEIMRSKQRKSTKNSSEMRRWCRRKDWHRKDSKRTQDRVKRNAGGHRENRRKQPDPPQDSTLLFWLGAGSLSPKLLYAVRKCTCP